jgi:hypothetical protein
VKIVPATPERRDDLADLFTRSGPRRGLHRAALRRLVRVDREPGLLAYVGALAVGWVAVAPREEHGRLVRSPVYRPTEPRRAGPLTIARLSA